MNFPPLPTHTHTHTHSHSSSPSREDWKLTSSFAFQGWEGAGDAADNFLLTCPWRLDHWGPMKWFYALSVLEGAGRKTAILVRSTTKTSECKQVQENFPQESLRNVLPQVPKGDGHPSPWGRMKSWVCISGIITVCRAFGSVKTWELSQAAVHNSYWRGVERWKMCSEISAPHGFTKQNTSAAQRSHSEEQNSNVIFTARAGMLKQVFPFLFMSWGLGFVLFTSWEQRTLWTAFLDTWPGLRVYHPHCRWHVLCLGMSLHSNTENRNKPSETQGHRSLLDAPISAPKPEPALEMRGPANPTSVLKTGWVALSFSPVFLLKEEGWSTMVSPSWATATELLVLPLGTA